MAKQVGGAAVAAPVWEGADYPRVAPGRYSAVAVRVQGPEWVRRYSRWSVLVEFELLGESDPVRVCAFLNMGDSRERTSAGRRSRYFKAWTIANGELPRKGQKMETSVFLEGQIFEIAVSDSGSEAAEGTKANAEIYSRVTDVLSAARPNHESFNQESINQESINPPIKQSTNQGGRHAKDSRKVERFASAGRR